jgi:hypothetical protein
MGCEYRYPFMMWSYRAVNISWKGWGWKWHYSFRKRKEKLSIGILGNGPGDKSLAIVLKPISPAMASQRRRYKRITRYDVIELPSSKWKAPQVIFIE